MNLNEFSRSCWMAAVVAWCVFSLAGATPVWAQAQDGRGADARQAPIGGGTIFVNSKFGGSIFGFDIDQNGTEGLLSEGQTLPNGNTLAAVETFDQATGKIVKVVKKSDNSLDDYVTHGIVGTSIGLVEHQIVPKLYITKRVYQELNPLDANKMTGTWKAPLTAKDIILAVSHDQGFATTAVFAFENGQFTSFVFGANLAAKTVGPIIDLDDQVFGFNYSPVMAYDTVTNQAVIASSTGAVGGPAPQIALVNLTTGDVTQFTGVWEPPYGPGSVNGIAVS